SATERLWERHREPLRRMIGLRLDAELARRVDASDVVQDVLVKANQRLRDYLRDPALPFHLWLRPIAFVPVIHQHRRHKGGAKRNWGPELSLGGGPHADRSSIDLAIQLRDPGMTPAASALRAELERRFQAAIARLGEDDREVVLLRHFEQLSNSEAARALG